MSYDLYVVTDDVLSNGRSHVEIAESAYEGGADTVQLRVKKDRQRMLEYAMGISKISKRFGRTFIVNDDVDVAVRSGADGVHVGQSDLPVSEVKKIVPDGFIIGVSVGSAEEAIKAEKDGASYVALSPIFDTSSKSDAGHGHGLQVLREIRSAVNIPVLAIGGINEDNVSEVIEAGADGVAVISAVVSKGDIAGAARDLRAKITASKARR